MEIKHKRIANISRGGRAYCISHIYVNGDYECDAIEDVDRGLSSNMTEAEIRSKKVKDKTAIPTGIYKVTLSVVSPKFSLKEYYKKFCGGKLPRILNVKGFDGILIHRGTNENSSSGCVIVGKNTIVGGVTDSQGCFERLYKKMKSAWDRGETLEYTIARAYK